MGSVSDAARGSAGPGCLPGGRRCSQRDHCHPTCKSQPGFAHCGLLPADAHTLSEPAQTVNQRVAVNDEGSDLAARVARPPLGRSERFDPDDPGRVRGVRRSCPARWRWRHVTRCRRSFLVLNKIEIARLDVGRPDCVSDLVLLFDDARDGDAVLREDVLHEPAAVEPAWIGASQSVGHAAEPHRELGDGSAVETVGEEIGCDGCEGSMGAMGACGCNGCVGCGSSGAGFAPVAPIHLSHPLPLPETAVDRAGRGAGGQIPRSRRPSLSGDRPALSEQRESKGAFLCIIGPIGPEVHSCQ